MVPHTRRRFLHVAAATAGGFAGCSQFTEDSAQSTRTATERARPDRSASNTATDPPTILVRADTAWPPVRLVDPDRESPETPEREPIAGRIRYDVVDSASRADRLTVADGVGGGDSDSDVSGDADSVSAFVDETDFDSETLVLHSARVGECFRLKLCHVSWQPDSIDTDYTKRLRPYDERCEADAHVFESRLIRIPVALDEGDVNSYSSSIGGSGHCDPAERTHAEASTGSDGPTESPPESTTATSESTPRTSESIPQTTEGGGQ